MEIIVELNKEATEHSMELEKAFPAHGLLRARTNSKVMISSFA